MHATYDDGPCSDSTTQFYKRLRRFISLFISLAIPLLVVISLLAMALCSDHFMYIHAVDNKNKPGRANRCVRSGSVCNRNVLRLFWALFGGFFRMVTDGHTDGHTDIRTYGRTDPLIEMRGRI